MYIILNDVSGRTKRKSTAGSRIIRFGRQNNILLLYWSAHLNISAIAGREEVIKE